MNECTYILFIAIPLKATWS